MNKISFSQLACLFFISRIFAEANSHFAYQSGYGMQRFTVIALSFVLLLVVYIPLIVFVRISGGENVLSCIGKKSRFLSCAVGVLLLLLLLCSTLSTLVHLEYYATSTIFTSAPALLVILLPAVCAVYAIKKGTETAARAGAVVLAAFVVLLVLIIISISSKMNFSYLYPALVDDADTLWGEVLTEFSKNAELPLFAVFCGTVREKPLRCLWVYLPCAFVVTELMNLLYVTVFGRYFNSVVFPFYTLSSFSDIVVLQRLDGIDAVVWTMAAITRLAILAIGADIVLRDGLHIKYSRITAAVLTALVIPAALYFSRNEPDFVRYIVSVNGTGIPLAAVTLLASVTAGICAARLRKKEEKCKI